MAKSLGIFALGIVGLLISVAFYLILAAISRGKLRCLHGPKDFMHKQLFYNSFLRYMFVSNLKLTALIWGFFIYSYNKGFSSPKNFYYTLGYLLGLVFVLIYPIFIMYFLQKNQDILETRQMKRKYSTAYDGIYTESKQALLYNSVFCLRRFHIVLINITLNAECPWTNFEESRYFYKIILFLIV